MDEFNNNPFSEDKNNGGEVPRDPYNVQPDPYNQQAGQNIDPYNQQPAQGQQNYTYNQQGIPQGGYVPPQNDQYQQNANPQNYPGPGFNPYQQQGVWQGAFQPQYYAKQQSTGMALASLVLGIISICTGLFMYVFPILFLVPIVGLILGIVFKCKKLPVGKGMSTAGIITSVIGPILPLILSLLLLANMPELMQELKNSSPEQYEQLYEMYGEMFPEWFEGIILFLKR